MRKNYKVRVLFISFLIFAFCAIQFSTVHIHPSDVHESVALETHQLEVHLYNSDSDKSVLYSESGDSHEHSHSGISVEVEYDSTLQKVLSHLLAYTGFGSWYTTDNFQKSVSSLLQSESVGLKKQDYYPYLKSQAPPIFS